ncbi:MAG: hypothetical protein IPH16_00270 [Haliscomenobacter sp.]|nr:hypothetical protein [Haliscomenobacter sp.]
MDLFLVADCSGEDTCSLLSSKMEVIGGSLIIEKRYIVDPFEEVFIIIDSRTENPIPYELQVGLPYDNGRREFWGIFDQKVTCNPASFTYDLELTFNIAGIFEVLSTAFEVQNPGINQYVIKDIPLLREIELTLVERLSAGSDQAAVIVIPPVECDCSGFMEAGLQLPERIVCADPQNLFSAREASGQTVIWHTRFEDLEFEETGFEFYLQGELNVYAQRHDSLRGCYSFRQTLPNQFPEENFELISIPQSCKNKGSIKAQPLNSTAPLFYQWSAHPDRETPYLEGLSAGSYSVTITDEKGCQYALEAEVEEEAVPILKGIEIKDASCSLANGAIELIPSMPDLQMFIDTLPGVRQENLKNGLYEIHVFQIMDAMKTAPF